MGDWVRIKLPRYVHKGGRDNSKPIQVVKVNKGSVITQDGKCWSVRRVSLFAGHTPPTVEADEAESRDSFLLDEELVGTPDLNPQALCRKAVLRSPHLGGKVFPLLLYPLDWWRLGL